MPYICLARNDIPDGTLQILDLLPNTSLRNQSIDPPGQTRYINRAQNEAVLYTATTGATLKAAKGLRAYLLDKVEPGGILFASGTVTFVNAQDNDTVTIAGVVFKLVADGNEDFTKAGTALDPILFSHGAGNNDAGAAAGLVVAISNVAVRALLTAALGAGLTLAAAAALGVVTLTAGQVSPDFLTNGTLASSNPARVVLSAARLRKTTEVWTNDTLEARAAAILARVDAGQALALADINTVLSSVGAELTNAGGSQSVGTVAEVLEILAGRGYVLPAGSQILDSASLALNPSVNVFDPTVRGSFTHAVVTNDARMLGGEWRPLAAGGDTEQVENKPIRSTVDGDSFQQSLQNGALYHMQSASNTLFPDSDLAPFSPWTYQKAANHTAEVARARLVTVYNDDGSLA